MGNLQSKVEGLTTTNALMKEDLAIARNSLMALQAENLALRQSVQHGAGNGGHPINNQHVLDHIDPDMADALSAEKKKRQDVERELELQVIYHLRLIKNLFLGGEPEPVFNRRTHTNLITRSELYPYNSYF